MKTKFKKIFFILFVLILISFAFIFSSFICRLENVSQDWKQNLSLSLWQSRNKSSILKDNIIILSIDDLTSFDLSNHPGLNLNKWPLSRTTWAEAVDFIEKGKPKVLSVAIPFKNYEEVTLSEQSSDIILSNTLKKYNNIVLATVLGSPYPSLGKSTTYNPTDIIQNPFKPIRKSLDVVVDNQNTDVDITYFSYSSIPNIFVENAQMGYINFEKSCDSSIRSSRPVSRLISGNAINYMPSFAFATFLKYIKYDGPIKISNSNLRFSQYSIPVNENGENLINWNGISRTYTYIPFSKILIGMKVNGKSFEFNKKVYPVEYFKDKIVLIAPTQTYVNTYKTPIDTEMSGAEINANIIDNYISDSRFDNLNRRKFIRELPLSVSILVALTFTFLIVANTLLFRTSILSFLNSILLIFLYIFFDLFAFIHPKIRLDFLLIYPLFFMSIAFICSYIYVMNDEKSKRKEIISLFGNSVSSYILKRLLKNAQNFDIKPLQKKITVMYCDVSAFSSFIEKHPEVDAIEKLNSIFSIATKKIFKYNGTIDKFIGDSILAYWGDPIPSTNDSLSAVKAAVEIIKEIEDINLSLSEDDLKLNVKISIHTGEALVGVVGNSQIQDYTILGDTVNIVNRMDDICSQFNKKLIISETVYKSVNNFIQANFIGTLKLKGKDVQVGLYAPKLGKNND